MKKVMWSLLAASMLAASDDVHVALLDDFEQSLMEGLEEVSDIATKTKLNIDQTPAFITILYRDTLAEFGVDTVYEALSLIPGVELSMEPTGAKQVIFRGIKEKGKIKLLIDGIPINNTFRGSMYHYLDLPAELVDRIEVIRGPGSVLYGSNAINAVINVITKSGSDLAGTGAYLSTATYNQHKAGGLYTFKNGTFKLAVDAYSQQSNKQIDAGPDASLTYKGESYEALRDYSVGIVLNNDHWSLYTRTKSSVQGGTFGGYNYLERDKHRPGIQNITHFGELAYKLSAGIHETVFKAGLNHYEQHVDTTFIPSGSGDIVYMSGYQETGAYAELTTTTTLSNHCTLVYGLYASRTEALQENFYSNHPLITSTELIKPEVERTITAAYLQSSSSVSDTLDILAGVRLDHYSDFGDALSPRLAAVYAVNDDTNLKVMYSRAFRAPSWVELYSRATPISTGDESLSAETADTFEVGIVTKKDIENLIRFNLFYTNVNDIIYRDSTSYYTQHGTSHFYGGELEYKKRLALATTMTLNVSHTDGVDREDNAITDIANQTANLQLAHKFQNRLTSGSKINYVGPRKRVDGDPRDDLEGYTTLDQTFSYRYQNGLFLSFSIKNLLDSDVRYPAPYDFSNSRYTYEEDYPREGRTFWLKVSWDI